MNRKTFAYAANNELKFTKKFTASPDTALQGVRSLYISGLNLLRHVASLETGMSTEAILSMDLPNLVYRLSDKYPCIRVCVKFVNILTSGYLVSITPTLADRSYDDSFVIQCMDCYLSIVMFCFEECELNTLNKLFEDAIENNQVVVTDDNRDYYSNVWLTEV